MNTDDLHLDRGRQQAPTNTESAWGVKMHTPRFAIKDCESVFQHKIPERDNNKLTSSPPTMPVRDRVRWSVDKWF
ncbi:hypothetical protein EVAR_41250_1 [Eumeta japonica]|uniref:Uncharacterized protein n=1 Tax=Eumeta variegata TaxID=151549 RepID=A0A4C1W3Q0_EUMVA|nr:hypothetical protein EVAR_41250_1 [Eumeta japonica]